MPSLYPVIHNRERTRVTEIFYNASSIHVRWTEYLRRQGEGMKSIELFAGAGGLGIGTFQAGFVPEAVIEWDRDCCDTIRNNQGNVLIDCVQLPLFQTDVRVFDFAPYEDRIDLVSGGPPCQPFSRGGKHRGRDDSRDLFPEAVRAVAATRPKAFLFENVKGLTREAFREYFEYVTLSLSYPGQVIAEGEAWESHLGTLKKLHTGNGHVDLRYNVVSEVLNAANFGVPQHRERVFFVGFRSDLDVEWSYPEATHSREALLWEQYRSKEYLERHDVAMLDAIDNSGSAGRIRQRPDKKPWRTVRDALLGLPDPEQEPGASGRFHNHSHQPGAKSYPGHTGSPLDGPAKTLKAGVHGVPGGENTLRKPDGNVRYFTVRECARMQTLPDDYEIRGSWTESMRQIGNAVPVRVAQILARNIRRHLEKPELVAEDRLYDSVASVPAVAF